MSLSVRSSSLHDTTSLQRFGMAGALVASVLVIGVAVQVAPSIGSRSDPGAGAVSRTGYQAAPAIADPAGEHTGLGIASNIGYGAAVGISDPAGEHSGLGTAGVSNTGYGAAVGVTDPTGEHIGLGMAANTGYPAAVGISDPAGEHVGWGQPVTDFDDHRGWQQAPSQAGDQAAIDAGRHRPVPLRRDVRPERIGGR